MSYSAKILFPLFSALSLLSLLSGCGRDYRTYELDKTNFDAKTLQKIQSDTGIALPVGARGFNFYYKPPIDPAYIAKIEIPPSSKEELIQALSIIKNDENIHVTESLGTKVSWWIPKGTKTLLDRQSFVGAGNYLRVVLVEEDKTVILFIEWWTI
jgi:hypothetical protein